MVLTQKHQGLIKLSRRNFSYNRKKTIKKHMSKNIKKGAVATINKKQNSIVNQGSEKLHEISIQETNTKISFQEVKINKPYY